ncbi:hypothetical protein QMA10_14215 [Arthrobacter sp. APC 3897]|uniref:hypothetical protein n=1 Tax=Arthrobacter sp. APC 3897 TaxID=3035204 RepID=UPI0025B42B58|nr:hypothetical protein [Arthrobacter sp. APC 3897]MDN3483073.1 hypothetical protein [Arthrobacter sp. APC 3897]
MTAQLTSAHVAADRRADAALLGAASAGSAAAAVRLLTDGAVPPAVAGWAWVAAPAFFILLAYVPVASGEGKAGIRQQRGALAALSGLAVLSVAFTVSMPFSPFYGIALLLLGVRTRYPATAVVGVAAVLASVIVVPLSVPQGALCLGLLAVACAANCVRTASAARI